MNAGKTGIKKNTRVLNLKNSLGCPAFTDDLKFFNPPQTTLGTKNYAFSLTDVKGESSMLRRLAITAGLL